MSSVAQFTKDATWREQVPLVSVIIPAYNAEKYIEATLVSVLAQTHRNIEVLVVDDGSIDRTAEIVQGFACEDSRVVLLKQANAGVAAARNLGIESARGSLIAPVDADDIWYPRNLEQQVGCLLGGGEQMGMVYSWSLHIDEQGELTGNFNAGLQEGNVLAALIYRNFIGNASATLIRRSCLKDVGLYDPGYRDQQAQGMEDWDLYLRIAERYEVGMVPEFLVGYRQVSGAMSRNCEAMVRAFRLLMDRVAVRHPRLPPILLVWSRSEIYNYFAWKSLDAERCWDGLAWAVHALWIDPAKLTQPRGLRTVRCALEHLVRPWVRAVRNRPAERSPQTATLKDIERTLVGNRQALFLRRLQQIERSLSARPGALRPAVGSTRRLRP